MNRPIASPLLMAFLRVLAFVGITEALFYRMLPEASGREQGLVAHLHASLSSAGDMTFLLAFFILTVALTMIATRLLRAPVWTPGLNTFVSLGELCLATLGVSAFAIGGGAAFAAGFSLLALAIVLVVSMSAMVRPAFGWERAFAVCYASTVIASTTSMIAGAVASGRMAGRADALAAGALKGGELLLACSGVLSFLAFHRFERFPGSADRL